MLRALCSSASCHHLLCVVVFTSVLLLHAELEWWGNRAVCTAGAGDTVWWLQIKVLLHIHQVWILLYQDVNVNLTSCVMSPCECFCDCLVGVYGDDLVHVCVGSREWKPWFVFPSHISQAPERHYATACMESDLHIVFLHPPLLCKYN